MGGIVAKFALFVGLMMQVTRGLWAGDAGAGHVFGKDRVKISLELEPSRPATHWKSLNN